MYKWMVALDGSDNAREAFYTTLSLMNKRTDDLFLISTVQSTPLSVGKYQRYSDEIEETHRKHLLEYGRRCEEEGVQNYKPILARGSHIGHMICAAAEQKGIDFLVIGRRGMNRFSRLVVGSTSKHVMENAPCNVIVIKGTGLARLVCISSELKVCGCARVLCGCRILPGGGARSERSGDPEARGAGAAEARSGVRHEGGALPLQGRDQGDRGARKAQTPQGKRGRGRAREDGRADCGDDQAPERARRGEAEAWRRTRTVHRPAGRQDREAPVQRGKKSPLAWGPRPRSPVVRANK